jgi:hypothetical protein
MAWFQDHIYVGTSRANLQLLKLAMPFVHMDVWPVEVSDANYTPRFEHVAARGEIWRYHPPSAKWSRVFRAPLVTGKGGVEFSRDLGFRAMAVFQGKAIESPPYTSPHGRGRALTDPNSSALQTDGSLKYCPNRDFELPPEKLPPRLFVRSPPLREDFRRANGRLAGPCERGGNLAGLYHG